MAGSHKTTRTVPGTRVFICDDAPALRDLLRIYLEQGGDVAVVGEAGDGLGLAAAVRDVRADVVLLDLAMPHVDGFEALVELRAADPRVGVVVRPRTAAHSALSRAQRLVGELVGDEPGDLRRRAA